MAKRDRAAVDVQPAGIDRHGSQAGENLRGEGARRLLLDVNGNLTLTAGTLDVSGSNFGISVAGDWTDTGAGSFI